MKVDCVILMDCTGSMGSWIQAGKENALKAALQLRSTFPDACFRLGFMGYRDHSDSERFVRIPLSEDVTSVQRELMPVSASGGGDFPEDVAGGLRQTLDFFAWSGDVKVVLMVADAPAHGREYCSGGDDYPEGDPTGLDPKALVGDMARRGMDFTFIKCSSSTDNMTRLFQASFEAARASEEQAFSILDMTGAQHSHAPSSMPMMPSVCMPPSSASLAACEEEADMPCISASADYLSPPPPCLPSVPMPYLSSSAGPSSSAAYAEMAPPSSLRLSVAPSAPPMAMASRSMAMPSAASYGGGGGGHGDAFLEALTSSVTRSVRARVSKPAGGGAGAAEVAPPSST